MALRIAALSVVDVPVESIGHAAPGPSGDKRSRMPRLFRGLLEREKDEG